LFRVVDDSDPPLVPIIPNQEVTWYRNCGLLRPADYEKLLPSTSSSISKIQVRMVWRQKMNVFSPHLLRIHVSFLWPNIFLKQLEIKKWTNARHFS